MVFTGLGAYNTIFSTLQPETIKNIFSVVFTLLALATSVFGTYFLRRQNLHRLNKKKNGDRQVPITRMSSWLSLGSTLTYVWNTQRLPGGGYALVMIFSGALALAHPFFVNSFIQTGYISFPNQCTFQSGIITTKMSGRSVISASTLSASTTVYNAQATAADSYCALGIWDKIEKNTTNFCPFESDVLGGWQCSIYEPNPTTTTDGSQLTTNFTVMASILRNQSQGFFNNYSIEYASTSQDADNNLHGMLLLAANNTGESINTYWGARAILITNLRGIPSTAVWTNLDCYLNRTKSDWLPPVMPADATLKEWTPVVYGAIMNLNSTDYAFSLQTKLDAIVMTAGTFGNDSWLDSDLPAGQNPFYGCTLEGTAIQQSIWVLVGVMLLVLIPMVIFDLGIIIFDFIISGKEGLTTKARFIRDAPSGVETWQLALLRQATNDDSITTKQLKDYSYGWNSSKGDYELNRSEAFKIELAGSTQSSDLPTTKQEVVVSVQAT